MYSSMLKVSDCLEILRHFDIKMSEPALRQAIRKKQIKNTYLPSKKEGVNIPFASLVHFMIPKLPSELAAFELGKFYYEQTMGSELLPTGSFGDLKSYLANGLLQNEYVYIAQLGNISSYKTLYVKVDYDSHIIHLLDDSDLDIGISVINAISPWLIKDIWLKLGEETSKEFINSTHVNLYYRSLSRYGQISGYCIDENGFVAAKEPLYQRFEDLVNKTKERKGNLY